MWLGCSQRAAVILRGHIAGEQQQYQDIILHSLRWLYGMLAEAVMKDKLQEWDGLLTRELQ